MILKCKMCGGTLEFTDGATIATCDSCGTKQTLPRVDGEPRANLFNRANHFRRQNDFDKAVSAYERILADDDADAEAHWGVVLSRYGIEYVEDPKTHARIPTCHRVRIEPILSDADYQSALKYAPDEAARSLYEKEAQRIAEIQRGILAISQKEAPFDVFICYKETDESGRRTRDSALAQDVYYQLTETGCRVFFSRITLEDKLGQAYEPYIFAALNSAKVMVALGTSAENFNAVWVKNEWSRYLDLMKQDKNRLLIPCYRDMDPYDLPDALSILQSQDMSKIGFMQDLVRGIKKVLVKDEPKTTKETVVVNSGSASAGPLLKRAFMFLEDGDWNSANEYCEKVLDIDPETAMAYVGKLCAELQVKNMERLAACAKPFNDRNNYQKAVRFGDAALKNKLEGFIQTINERNEQNRLAGLYNKAVSAMQSASSEQQFKKAAVVFHSIPEYRDAAEKEVLCLKNAEETRLAGIYSKGLSAMQGANSEQQFKEASSIFHSIPEYRDAAEQEALCLKQAERVAKENRIAAAKQAEAERIAKAQQKKITIITFAAAAVIVAVILIVTKVIVPGGEYRDAMALLDAGEYDAAAVAFAELEDYRDADVQMKEAKYRKAAALTDAGEYYAAAIEFGALERYKDAEEKKAEAETFALDVRYNAAVALMDAEEYMEAAAKFSELGDFKDARERTFILRTKITQRDTVSAGSGYTVGLKANGTVVALGDNENGECNVSGWSDIVAISTGSSHTVGLKANGTVVAVGDNEDGQCRVSSWTNIVAVDAGSAHTVGLKADGTVVAVGNYLNGRCNVSGWTDIVSISAGYLHTLGLKADGTVVAVGYDFFDQCDVFDWTDIVAVYGKAHHTIGLKADGTVVAVGEDDYGECNVSDWRDIIAISTGASHTVGLKADGTVVATKYTGESKYYAGQCDVSDWRDIVAISAGGNHTVGLKADGTVVAVGDNRDGQCNVSGWRGIKVPEK